MEHMRIQARNKLLADAVIASLILVAVSIVFSTLTGVRDNGFATIILGGLILFKFGFYRFMLIEAYFGPVAK